MTALLLIWSIARRGELDGEDAEGDRVWLACTCGAVLVRVVAFS